MLNCAQEFFKTKVFLKSPFEEISPACDELWLLEEPQEYQDDEEHQHLKRTFFIVFFLELMNNYLDSVRAKRDDEHLG